MYRFCSVVFSNLLFVLQKENSLHHELCDNAEINKPEVINFMQHNQELHSRLLTLFGVCLCVPLCALLLYLIQIYI